MKIKMKRPYGGYKAGEVIEVAEGLAFRLLAWDYAVETHNQQATFIETASVEPVAERADLTPRKRKP